MITNADATLYRRGYDPEDRTTTWERVELPGVLWQDERHITVSAGAVEAADSVLIMVPGLDHPFKVGDKITRWIVLDEDPPDQALTVMSAVRVDFGSPSMHHWEVTAK